MTDVNGKLGLAVPLRREAFRGRCVAAPLRERDGPNMGGATVDATDEVLARRLHGATEIPGRAGFKFSGHSSWRSHSVLEEHLPS